MPVVHEGQKLPNWCELQSYEFISLTEGKSRILPRKGDKEEIVVCQGTIEVVGEELNAGQKMDLDSPYTPGFEITALGGNALVFHAAGRWESITSSGVFPVFNGDPAPNQTSYDYPKSTTFDNHYHDCDEYWIFFAGRCRCVSEGKFYDVGPGDCVVTGMGWHHDVANLIDCESAAAVWFEGTLEGQARMGHLWEPVHGKAEPQQDRV